MGKRLLTVKETAEYLGRSPLAVRELMYKNVLPFIKFDRRIYFDIRDLDNIIEKSKRFFDA